VVEVIEPSYHWNMVFLFFFLFFLFFLFFFYPTKTLPPISSRVGIP